MENTRVSNLLVDAVEYIKKFRNHVFVIKLGGEAMLDEKVFDGVAQDLVLLSNVGIKPVVVHGGGREISLAMEKFGKVPEFVEGLRVTDKETMDIVKMVLIGKINTEIVARINKFGGNAVGLSGKSGKLFLAEKKKSRIDLGFVGEVSSINSDLVTTLIDKAYIPIISPVGFSIDGESLNINADSATSKLAVSLKASKLIILTSVDGVMDSKGNLLNEIKTGKAKGLIKDKVATKGMIPKIGACVDALAGGVKSTHIIKSSEHAIIEEILTKEGTGTMIKND